MKTLAIDLLAAATLLTAAPALALEIGVGPDGIRVGPRYRDHEERYFRDRPYYRNSADCRRVTIEMPDGSVVTRYRCD